MKTTKMLQIKTGKLPNFEKKISKKVFSTSQPEEERLK